MDFLVRSVYIKLVLTHTQQTYTLVVTLNLMFYVANDRAVWIAMRNINISTLCCRCKMFYIMVRYAVFYLRLHGYVYMYYPPLRATPFLPHYWHCVAHSPRSSRGQSCWAERCPVIWPGFHAKVCIRCFRICDSAPIQRLPASQTESTSQVMMSHCHES